jgi:hypothetical protein
MAQPAAAVTTIDREEAVQALPWFHKTLFTYQFTRMLDKYR